jgi:membrane-bound lytic murein transglycosylase D
MSSFKSYLVAALVAVTASGCASSSRTHAIGQMLERDVGNVNDDLASRIMSENVPYKNKARTEIESTIQRKVWWWVRYYTVLDRARFKRNFSRGENYRPLVQQILTEHQLPPELFYLALIESGFVTHATSSTKAVGIWQFMRPTALHYGLGVDGPLDERRHPIAATHAAARYLSYLHKRFGSWYLAIAAYNAGQGRINQAIKRGKSNDFWKLAEKGFIPRETMDYIPKFLAAATIGNHLDEFGFQELEPSDSLREWPQVAAVKIKSGMKLSKVAKQAGLTEKELLRLNPQLKQALSYPGAKAIRIWVPTRAADRFAAYKTSLARS